MIDFSLWVFELTCFEKQKRVRVSSIHSMIWAIKVWFTNPIGFYDILRAKGHRCYYNLDFINHFFLDHFFSSVTHRLF
jgi:hypothetical protein